MKREGWEDELNEYLEDALTLTFRWGETDCCLWVARFVDRVTGSSSASAWEGQYDSQASAQSCMEARGFESPADIADAYGRETPVSLAMRGDVVLHPAGALGLCDGRRSHFLVEGAGRVSLDTLRCLRAWQV